MHHLNELMDSPINTEREEMKPFITENPFETPWKQFETSDKETTEKDDKIKDDYFEIL